MTLAFFCNNLLIKRLYLPLDLGLIVWKSSIINKKLESAYLLNEFKVNIPDDSDIFVI